jgi:hypothetical protein
MTDTDKPLRIRTARTLEEIEEGRSQGFFPLIKRIEPHPEIQRKFAVIQDLQTGAVRMVSDYRSSSIMASQEELILDFDFYYPYQWPLPFAAYLLPRDLPKGEKVWLEDLIEDFPGTNWNQGDVTRLESCEAIWTGDDLEILYEVSPDREWIIG